MDADHCRKAGRKMLTYITQYLDTVGKRRVTPEVEPGYLARKLPRSAPEEPCSIDEILKDVEEYIMPGITHWAHPYFYAYFPTGHSYPSIMSSMVMDGLGIVASSWLTNPASTELEMTVMEWYAKFLGLPESFSHKNGGGGVIQSTACESTLFTMVAARYNKLMALKNNHPFLEEGLLISRLMCYCSKETHSSIEKAAMMALVKVRILEANDRFQLTGEILQKAVDADKKMGLIPFFVVATIGTTSSCAYDVVPEIGYVCSKENIWLHIDGAYALPALSLHEFNYLHDGLDYANSIVTNPHKWLLATCDIACLWIKDRKKYTSAFQIERPYLMTEASETINDYHEWGMSFTRKARALKLWFIFRLHGTDKIQEYLRHDIKLAHYFKCKVLEDDRFEICNDVYFGLVCFRLKTVTNEVNETFLDALNASGKIHLVPTHLKEKFVLRWVTCNPFLKEEIVDKCWALIKDIATNVLEATAKLKALEKMESLDYTPDDEIDEEQTLIMSTESVRSEVDDLSAIMKVRRNFFTRMTSRSGNQSIKDAEEEIEDLEELSIAKISPEARSDYNSDRM